MPASPTNPVGGDASGEVLGVPGPAVRRMNLIFGSNCATTAWARNHNYSITLFV